MGTPSWQVTGQYYETCSCDFVCPCVPGQLAAMPTKGFCTIAMAFQIERGSYGTVPLDGLGFIVLLWTPEEMGKGNWSVGVIADAQASAEQHAAITSIASGSAGGPMAASVGRKVSGRGIGADPVRSHWRQMVGHGREARRHGRRRGHGDRPQHHRADLSGQHRPSSRKPLCPRPCIEEPC